MEKGSFADHAESWDEGIMYDEKREREREREYENRLETMAVKMPRIAEELNQLEKAISRIENLSHRMDEQLSPVCQPSPPMPERDGSERASIATGSPIADRLRQLRTSLESAERRSSDVLNRVEL